MRVMRSKGGAPEAYFLVNAYVHLGATNYLVTEEGEDDLSGIAFAAFDEMPYAPLMKFCRYSVSQPVAEMGIRAARVLLGRIAGDYSAPPEVARLPTTLIKHATKYTNR
jgi:LacI family transcriptional regulator